MVIVNFIRDPEVGIFARIKRKPKDRGGVPDGGQSTPPSSSSECQKD